MLRVGVIGAGVMGAEHARTLRAEVGGAVLAAVCDADPARADAAGQGAAVFADPQAMIRSDTVDAVIIASPDQTHGPLALMAMALGKPVLCEKPLAATAAEALRIVEAEVALGRRLVQVGYMRRFDPGYQALKDAAAGIGAPVLLHNTHRNAAAPDWFTGPMSITNSFVHEIDISRWLLGADPARVTVHAAPGGDPLQIVMTTVAGVLISTEVNMNAAYGYHVHAQLVGQTGTVELAPAAQVTQNHAGQQRQDHALNWVPRFRDAYRIQMRDWIAAIASGTPCGASAWDGYAATAIADQVVTALQQERTVEIALPARPALYA